MRRALSTRSCAGPTHVGAVSLRTPTSHTTTRRADAFPILRSLKESRLKLYYSPGACSLAVHIALIEADATFQLERVDLRTKKTESGADFTAINPKGYVPALALDSGEIVTENLAVLDWIAAESSARARRAPGPHTSARSAGLLVERSAQELQHVLRRRKRGRDVESEAGRLAETGLACRNHGGSVSAHQRRRLLPLRHVAVGDEVRHPRTGRASRVARIDDRSGRRLKGDGA